jgi:hypothetical protein
MNRSGTGAEVTAAGELPPGTTIWNFYKDDPAPHFAKLRAQCPVQHQVVPKVEREDLERSPLVARPTDQFWYVLDHEGVQNVLQNPSVFTSTAGPGPEWIDLPNDEGVLLVADDPAHARHRQIANKAFLPRMVNQRLGQIQALVDDLIDGFDPSGHAEVVVDLAAPLTTAVIADIFGAGSDRLEDLYRWGRATMESFAGDDDQVTAGLVAMQELFAFLQGHIDERRQILREGGELSDDVLSAMIAADYNGSHLTDQEILGASHQMLTAGFETTTVAIANGVVLLCRHDTERRKLADDPALWPIAVEEILRFEPPLEGLFRSTNQDTELDGCPIPAHSKVRWVLASANRDPAVFDDPDTFNVSRPASEVRRHLTFGVGPHACIGSALARAETTIALRTLFRRLPGVRLDGTPVKAQNFPNNGFTAVPITWDPDEALTRESSPPERRAMNVCEEQAGFALGRQTGRVTGPSTRWRAG